MNTTKVEVPIDNDLKAKLIKMSSGYKFNMESLALIKETVPHLGSMISIVTVLIWLFLNWIIGLFTSLDFGWNSDYHSYIFGGIIIISFAYTLFTVVRRERPNANTKKQIKKDLTKGVIELYTYMVKDLKVFVEPEHGGFIYFILSTDDEVIAIFDSESQDLSISDKDPKSSSFIPRRTLEIYKTIYSNIVVDDAFKGKLIEFPELRDISLDTTNWPEHGELINCLWGDIENTYSD